MKKIKFSGEEAYNEYQMAAGTIEQDWFQALDERAREECSQFIPDESEEHEGKAEGKKNHEGKKTE